MILGINCTCSFSFNCLVLKGLVLGWYQKLKNEIF